MNPQKYYARAVERFWAKVDFCEHGVECETCCWPWLAATWKDGYGRFQYHGESRRATQMALEFFSGKVYPRPLQALHTCDTPLCVNPYHLYMGTMHENMDDMLERNREARKLSPKKARRIRKLYATGNYTQESLAAFYHVTGDAIHAVLTFNSWDHAGGPRLKGTGNLRPRGSWHHNAKLTEAKVLEIRAFYATGRWKSTELADLYGVSKGTIYFVVQRKIWKHI